MSSTKRVQFGDDELPGSAGGDVKKKFKNSLDSDEEDDEEDDKRYNLLNPDDVEGQEDKTIEYDGNIKITPFNMDDELEEGHFDKEGMFIFKRDKEEIRDNWLDNIDWVNVKTSKDGLEQTRESDDSDDQDERTDVKPIYEEMLELMKPGETVLACIKRLGGGKRDSSINRWKKKKDAAAGTNGASNDDADKNKELLLKMTGLADRIIATGDMDIYQQTYERLKFLAEKKDSKDEPASKDASFDMFAEDVDDSKIAEETEKDSANSEEEPKSNEVMWEFKWENTEDAPIYGQHSSSEMLQWVRDGYFEGGVWVRKADDKEAPFYSSQRIDFELYI